MTAPAKPKYRTTKWKDYNTALKARGSLLILLDKDMCWQGSTSGKQGRRRTDSEAAIQFCLTIKGLFDLALRQAMGMAQSLLKLAGLEWRVPDFSTFSRRQKHLSATIGARPTTTGLHLLVDSTGIKILGEGEWKTKKHGADHRRQWRKVHLGIDATTLEIPAIEVTDNATGDAPILPCLLDQIADDETVAGVSGDGAYDTKGCHEAIAQRGAQAVTPTRKNAKPWKDQRPGAKARNAIPTATRLLGRKIWKKWSGYRRRSLVETKMRCFKALGERVMARDFDRQIAELQVRAAILNQFTRLGTPTTVAVTMPPEVWGITNPTDLRNKAEFTPRPSSTAARADSCNKALYNYHILQRAIGRKTPILALKEWQQKRPELFVERVYDQTGLDT